MRGRELFRYAAGLALALAAACQSFADSKDDASADAGSPPLDGGADASVAPDASAFVDAADDAVADADAEAGPSVPKGGKHVFVTAGTFTIVSAVNPTSSVARADALCGAEAVEAGLPNTYVAWISTEPIYSGNAIGRLKGGKWFLVEGTPVASMAELALGMLEHAIDRTAAGDVVSIDPFEVWTGTRADGTGSGASCSDWISSSAGSLGGVGDLRVADGGWTDSKTDTCQLALPLYCFEL